MTSPGRERDRLRREYVGRHLRGIAVEELIRFPGIGPVTVSRIRDEGFTNIYACQKGNLGRVPGVGPSREADLRTALRQVERDAESRFDAGACPEAVAFKEELAVAKERRADERSTAEAKARAYRAVLQSLQEHEKIVAELPLLPIFSGISRLG